MTFTPAMASRIEIWPLDRLTPHAKPLGNTVVMSATGSFKAVHPHACGEHPPHLLARWGEFFTGVAYTCKIGLEDNLTPADYPMMRLVPSVSRDGATLGQRKTELLIYFGLPIHAFDDVPDSAGRVRLEKRYAALLTMEAAICVQVDHSGAQYVETIFDEDRIDASYKLMAVRVMLHG